MRIGTQFFIYHIVAKYKCTALGVWDLRNSIYITLLRPYTTSITGGLMINILQLARKGDCLFT